MTDSIVNITRAAIAVLVVMIIITAVTGVSQETFEIVREPSVYATELRNFEVPLRALFGLDSAFLILYATMLVLVATSLMTPNNRVVLAIAIGAILLTAVLDMIEDHHILAMLRATVRGTNPSNAQIVFEHTLSQVKFNVGYFAEFLIGLCVPRRTLTGRLLAFLLTVGTLVQSAWLYSAPDVALPAGNYVRWIGFLLGFALIIRLGRQPTGGAAAINARA
jgi:hypothetical protein